MKKLLIVVVAVLLMMGSYFLGKNESSASPGTKKAQAPLELATTAASGTTVFTGKNGEVISENELPLPPANMPLNEIYRLLQRRADAGDGKAACRLAIELIRCRQALHRSKYMSGDTDIEGSDGGTPLKPSDKLRMANSIDEERLTVMEKVQSCGKVPANLSKQTFKYLRQAANASQPDAMMAYADGQGLDDTGGFAMIRSNDFDVWRRDAIPVAQRALQLGVPEAVFLFSNGYSEDNAFFSSMVVDDAIHAETMKLLRLRIEGKALPVQTTLDASGYQRALSESDAMFRNYFRGQVQPKVSFMKRLRFYTPSKNEELAPCE